MAFRASRHLPITANEFSQMFRNCEPPVGWSKNIGVANSGGPDSSCLLFLLHRHLAKKNPGQPQRVFSLTIDHALQPASAGMADFSSKFAQKLGVEHVTSVIPWSQPPYPPLPAPGEPFESIARGVRYQALFDAMTQKDINNLAFGHHIDDQVETSLLRISWGSTSYGAAGMKFCRRWGMGKQVGIGTEFGIEGMKRWIVRPMLDVSKDRILATCEANRLEYVTDTTNFQPSVTLRNAIRHEIQMSKEDKPHAHPSMLPNDIVERLMTLETTTKTLPNVTMSLDSSIDELRAGVRALSRQARDIDGQVDSIVKRWGLPTIPGTFLILSKNLRAVETPDVRRALVLRLMRYVSPYPWGSMSADAGRRKVAIDRIIEQLWKTAAKASIFRPFTAGGGVLWLPALVKGDSMKVPQITIKPLFKEDEVLGWLVARQPPLHREKLISRGLPNTLEMNVTKTIMDAYTNWTNGGLSTVSILYDCRYLVHFNLDRMPQDLIMSLADDPASENQLMILSRTRWFLPTVVIDRNGVPETLQELCTNVSNNVPVEQTLLYSLRTTKPPDSGWIDMEWIRPLTAL